MSNERIILARNLRALIKKAGYNSPEEFVYAERLSKSTIYRILRKAIDPKLSTLVEIAKKLEVDFSQLYPGKKR